MKKIIVLLMVAAMMLTGCATESSEPEHTMEFVESKNMVLDEKNFVALFYDYTNGSGETAIPCEQIDVKAFQNGVELVVWVYTGQKMDGAVQCDTSIQSGTTARIIWLFEKADNSPVSVEMTDGQKFVVGE